MSESERPSSSSSSECSEQPESNGDSSNEAGDVDRICTCAQCEERGALIEQVLEEKVQRPEEWWLAPVHVDSTVAGTGIRADEEPLRRPTRSVERGSIFGTIILVVAGPPENALAVADLHCNTDVDDLGTWAPEARIVANGRTGTGITTRKRDASTGNAGWDADLAMGAEAPQLMGMGTSTLDWQIEPFEEAAAEAV